MIIHRGALPQNRWPHRAYNTPPDTSLQRTRTGRTVASREVLVLARDLRTKPRCQLRRNLPVLRFEPFYLLRKIGVIGDPHFRALRNSASLNPRTLPVTMSS